MGHRDLDAVCKLKDLTKGLKLQPCKNQNVKPINRREKKNREEAIRTSAEQH